jgi:parallel beta-helix repeat protein
MKKKFIPLIFIFLFFFSIILFSVFFNSTPINTNSNVSSTKPANANSGVSNFISVSFPMKIFKPGYYQLTTDIVPTDIERPNNSFCSFFGIYSSDVVFDGMGHIIDGSRITPPCTSLGGLWTLGTPGDKIKRTHITVKNVTFSNFDSAISIRGVRDLRLENVTITNNTWGISIYSSSNVSLINNIFMNNKEVGISGRDNEKVTINNNKITSSNNGIQLDGREWVSPIPHQIDLFGVYRIKVPESVFPNTWTLRKTTSGTKYLITHNFIQNTINDGIWILDIDDIAITENAIVNDKNVGISCENCGLKQVFTNNTLNGKRTDVVSYSGQYYLSWSIIIGIIFFLLFSGTSNIAIKITQNKFLNYLWTQYHWLENVIRSFIRKGRVSILFEDFTAVSIIGLIIFGTAYASKNFIQWIWSGLTIPDLLIGFCSLLITSGIVTVTPRAVQYLLAIRKELDADYRLWWGGIFIIIITLLPPFASIFGQPVKIEMQDEAKYVKREIFITKITGPLTTILLSIGFFILYLNGAFSPYSVIGLQMSLLTSVVMLLPLSPMEGVTLWNWNKIEWAILFFPVLIAYYSMLMIPT